MRAGPSAPKNKTGSILLAVFLGFWTWLYTYKKDGWKFWLSLSLTALGMMVMALTTVIILAKLDNVKMPTDPITAWLTAWLIAYAITVGLWVWGILDTATKNAAWYANYPQPDKTENLNSRF
jgi:hypothetical protein